MVRSQEVPIGSLASVHRLWSRLEDVCAAAAGVLIAIAMCLTVVEVLSRKLLNAPLPGVIDMFDLGMAAVAFLGASQCQRLGGHVRMELVVRRLNGRSLWCVESLTALLALCFILAVCIASYEAVTRAYRVSDSTMDLLLPVWPAKLLVSIALTVLSGRLALQFIDSLRLIVNPDAVPIAALKVASVEDHAREEIEEAIGPLESDASNGKGQ